MSDFEEGLLAPDDSQSDITGSFTTLPFGKLLKLLHFAQRSGILYMENEDKRTTLLFEKGNIIGVSSSDPIEQLGNFMVSQGVITDRERNMAAEIAGNTNMPLGRILVTGKKVTESEMQRLLRIKAEQVIISILQWRQGEFSFHNGISVGRLFVRIQIDPLSFLPDETQENVSDTAEIVLETNPQLVTIIPVDNFDRPILFCEMKIIELDSPFKRLENQNGLSWELHPGDYNIKIFLPTLFLKTVPLRVNEGQTTYRIVVQQRDFQAVQADKQSFDLLSAPAVKSGPVKVERLKERIKVDPPKTEPVKPDAPITERKGDQQRYSQNRKEKRFDISIPVSFRTRDGNWFSTSCINLSSSGLCVIICDDPPDSDLYVRLFVPIYTAPLECPGSVCWVKHGRVPKIGVRLYLSDQMKSSLDNWLIHHDRSRS